MSIKRLFGAIIFRALIIGSIVTGLSFLITPAMPVFIVSGVLALTVSVASSISKCKYYSKFDDIPMGDLELYDIPQTKQNIFSKVETKVLDTIEELPNKIIKIKNSPEKKENNLER